MSLPGVDGEYSKPAKEGGRVGRRAWMLLNPNKDRASTRLLIACKNGIEMMKMPIACNHPACLQHMRSAMDGVYAGPGRPQGGGIRD